MFEDVKKDDAQLTSPPQPTEDMFADVDSATPSNSVANSPSAVTVGKVRPVTGPVPTPTQAPSLVPESGLDSRPVGPAQPLQDLSQMPRWSKRSQGGGFKTFFVWILSLALIIGVGFGGFWAYDHYIAPALQKAGQQNKNTNANTNAITPQTNTNQPTNNQQPVAPLAPANIDQDGDQLPDVEEQTYGTDINNPDTDRDGLTDQEEVKIYNTDPLLPDTDNDGLNDREEVMTWKTNPNSADSDGDGYQDGEEVSNGYDPNGSGKLIPPQAVPQPQ